MAPKIKLIYFNAKGRAELARLVLAEAGVDYEDQRLTFEEFGKIKESTPFGQLPLLEYDGEVIAQSLTIARFLAKEFGLAGKNNVEAAKVDMIADGVSDFLNKAIPIMMEKDEARKKEKVEAFRKDVFPAFLKQNGAILRKNGGKFIVGDKITYADIFFAATLQAMSKNFGEEWRKHAPVISTYIDGIFERPNIKKWIETRPVTDM